MLPIKIIIHFIIFRTNFNSFVLIHLLQFKPNHYLYLKALIEKHYNPLIIMHPIHHM